MLQVNPLNAGNDITLRESASFRGGLQELDGDIRALREALRVKHKIGRWVPYVLYALTTLVAILTAVLAFAGVTRAAGGLALGQTVITMFGTSLKGMGFPERINDMWSRLTLINSDLRGLQRACSCVVPPTSTDKEQDWSDPLKCQRAQARASQARIKAAGSQAVAAFMSHGGVEAGQAAARVNAERDTAVAEVEIANQLKEDQPDAPMIETKLDHAAHVIAFNTLLVRFQRVQGLSWATLGGDSVETSTNPAASAFKLITGPGGVPDAVGLAELGKGNGVNTLVDIPKSEGSTPG